MLEYLVRGKARRSLFQLLWGQHTVASVSELARRAGVSFSAAHRELEAMRAADLAVAERVGAGLHYRAKPDHPHAALLRGLATSSDPAATETRDERRQQVRTWLAGLGAPLGAGQPTRPAPRPEEVVAEALVLSHRDATVARVLPLVLFRQRANMDFDHLVLEASRRDERQALGYFLELAGRLGEDARLVEVAQGLSDGRRKKARMFFAGPHGRHGLAATRRNTPEEARRWGFLMNMGVDSFQSMFDKFAPR